MTILYGDDEERASKLSMQPWNKSSWISIVLRAVLKLKLSLHLFNISPTYSGTETGSAILSPV